MEADEVNNEIVKRKLRFPLWICITAGIVAFAIIVSLTANAAVAVRRKLGEDPEAAVSYLVGKTDHVNAGTVDRLREKLQTLEDPVTLEDHYRLAGTQIAEEEYAAALGSIERCIALDDRSNEALSIDLLMKKGRRRNGFLDEGRVQYLHQILRGQA